jgi:hypothetical protein
MEGKSIKNSAGSKSCHYFSKNYTNYTKPVLQNGSNLFNPDYFCQPII